MRSLGGWKQSRRWGGWGGGNVRNEVGGSGKWKWGETVLSYVTIIWKSWRSTFVSSLGPKDSLQYLLLLLLILSLLLLLSSTLKLITICAISRYIHNRNTILLTRFITHDSRANHYVTWLTRRGLTTCLVSTGGGARHDEDNYGAVVMMQGNIRIRKRIHAYT